MFNEKNPIKINVKNDLKEGTYIIINKKTGLVLDVLGGSVTSGTKMIQYTRHNGTNQRFQLLLKENGECEFSPHSAPNMALDIASASKDLNANLQIYQKNNSTAQRFRFEKNADGSYKIFTKCSDFKCSLSIENDSKEVCAKVVQNIYTTATSNWTLEQIN